MTMEPCPPNTPSAAETPETDVSESRHSLVGLIAAARMCHTRPEEEET